MLSMKWRMMKNMQPQPKNNPGLTSRERLLAKMKAEQQQYRNALMQKSGCASSRSFEYIAREHILRVLPRVPLFDDQVEALLRLEHPVADIYSEFTWYGEYKLSKDHWEVIGKAISSCANNVLRKEFLHSKGWPVTD